MKRILIPDTELSVCPIGLGTVKAGLEWRGAEANRIFDAYFDMGGNMIDTARVYAGGHSEKTVGEWLCRSGKRSGVVVVTKGGHPKFDSPGDDLHIPRMTAKDMREDIEKSLTALRTDVIDLYFYHRDDVSQSVEEEIEVMEQFRKEGKIRYYGCSNWTAERIKKADAYCAKMGYRGFAADQALLNIGMKYMNPLPDDTLVYMKDALFDYHTARSENLAMPYMGVASGFFHTCIGRGADAAMSSPYYTEGNLSVVNRCKELMEQYGATISQVVLGFFTQQPFACAPLYGPRSVEQIEDALGTLEIAFSPEDYVL